MLLMFSVALPVLLSVTVCGLLVVFTFWLLKFKLVVDSCTTGAPALLEPVPVRLTLCGLLLSFSLMFRLPVRVPVAVGANPTLGLQININDNASGSPQSV